jgi:hypothetical protein
MVHKIVYAKKVYDYERGIWIQDRTKLKSKMAFDVDFFGRGNWNYDSSTDSFEKAQDFAKKIIAKTGAHARVVESKTGKVIFSV